ncbi:NAD-dependent epimerase/dehydratase family protein [Paenibacillus sp. GCM10023248]|uniref:NAD-dependent epimerase/dehydratase family protein n=1 Tax=unclassified Paenibacillus TaxID=185978 RepID=UPI002378DD92|nr:NAD-dependent epimerase/dehydratase family protein [Paenibacillus sp. MAHUQ-63]MDD9266599.1 NAD-dependent epimerase/dehydratase family protein [Paenibacillus sp. MAHUQ-63]
MKILVTGGAGFIASHIVDLLVDLGHYVAILDNFSTGKNENVNARAKVYKMDILDDRTADIFLEFEPDIVIHHAAQIDIQSSIKDPAFDATTNIVGTVKLLENCKKTGVKKIIYASSAAVYGDPRYLPVDEYHPVRPLSYYGISKHTPEHYIEVFSTQNDIDYTILRYANVYGTRQDPKGEGGVVSIFIDKIMDKAQPIIFGDGEQTRDFIYVKDVARANIAALDKGSKGIYNISCNTQTSVNELLNMISEASNVKVVPGYREVRSGDILHSFLDNTSAMKDLNWEPRYSLRDGLQETCDYYLTHSINNN